MKVLNKLVTNNSQLQNNIVNLELEKAIATLTELTKQGKNALVLLQVAKSIKADKPLPVWADVYFGKEHFMKIFSLKTLNLKKVCSSDSYAELRSIINAYANKGTLTEKQAQTFQSLMTIQTFAKNTELQRMKTELLWQVAETMIFYFALACNPHKINAYQKAYGQAQRDKQSLTPKLDNLPIEFTNLELFKNKIDQIGSESDLVLMLEIIQSKLDAQSQAQTKPIKVA